MLREDADFDLARVNTRKSAPPKRRTPATHTALSGLSIDQLLLGELETLMQERSLPKADLVRIAAERFAIPRSKLLRMNREAVIAAIRSAAENEGALDVIARAARDEGSRRT